MEISGKKALVFGGTSGIGLATVEQLSDLGAEVIAIGRNPEKITEIPAAHRARVQHRHLPHLV